MLRQISLLTLVLVTVGLFFHSCKKELTGKSNLENEENITPLIKQKFAEQNVEKTLTARFNDSVTIKWLPDWDHISSKKVSDSITYYYVPLTPRLLAMGHPGRQYTIKTISFEQYLIARKSKLGSLSIYRATYSRLMPDQQRTETSRDGMNYARFTGHLLLDNFAGLKTVFKYNSGVPERKTPKGEIHTEGWVCDQECTWTAYCTGADLGDGDFSVTVTYGRAGQPCDQPMVPEPECGFAGAISTGWMLSTTDQTNCLWENDDDPSTPPDNGGGGDGGDTGSGGGQNTPDQDDINENVKSIMAQFVDANNQTYSGVDPNFKTGNKNGVSLLKLPIVYTGYVVSFSWDITTALPKLTDIKADVTGLTMGIFGFNQMNQTYTANSVSDIRFTVTGSVTYTLFIKGIGTVYQQPVTLNGTYNATNGHYTLTQVIN